MKRHLGLIPGLAAGFAMAAAIHAARAGEVDTGIVTDMIRACAPYVRPAIDYDLATGSATETDSQNRMVTRRLREDEVRGAIANRITQIARRPNYGEVDELHKQAATWPRAALLACVEERRLESYGRGLIPGWHKGTPGYHPDLEAMFGRPKPKRKHTH